MALEQQIKQAIEAATAQLAGQFQERLQSLASELGQEASALHARELEEAVARVRAELTSQHEAAVAALRTETAEQRDLAVAMARTEASEQHETALAGLKAELMARHESETETLRAQFEVVQEAIRDRLSAELGAQHGAALETLRSELTTQHDAALDALRSELGARHEAELEALRSELLAQHDAALDALRSELGARHEAELAALRSELLTQHDAALDALRSELGARHEAELEALRSELLAQQEAAVTAAADAARAEAESQRERALAGLGTELSVQQEAALEALRAELTSRHDEAVAGLRAQLVAEHEAALAAALAASRDEASRQHDSAIEAVRAEADERAARAIAEADGRVAQARAEADQMLSHARAEADARLAAAITEAEANAAGSIAAARAAVESSGRDLVDARAAERQAELAFAERLSDAIRRLDSARSLIEVVDVLVDAAAREVPRVAVFLVRGSKLAGWRAAGFTRDNDPRELEVPLDQAGLLTKAVRSSTAVTASDASPDDGGSTPFGALPVASAAVAVPLRVGGETVGVLYADDVSTREHEAPSVWPESVDVLARHACRCLEVVTITRVTQPISIPAPSRPTPTPRRYTPQARTFLPGHDDDDDAARRYARLLVSEIKLYHESAVTAGRRDRNLLERLRTEIDRARRLYGERVPPAVQARTDYFDQELVRTLANGDASLLGPA